MKKSSLINAAIGGWCLASALGLAAPWPNNKTVAVTEQRAAIESQMQELGATETLFMGDKGKRTTFAIRGTQLVAVAEENPKIKYNEKGIPQSESRDALWGLVVLNAGFGLANLGLAVWNRKVEEEETEEKEH